MFLILDELRVANWQRTKAGSKGTNKPKRLSPLVTAQRKTYGNSGSHTDDEIKTMLARYGPSAGDG